MSRATKDAADLAAVREALTESGEPIPLEVLSFLQTLRRLPDDVVLDMATREFQMGEPDTCVCGWAIRHALARRLDVAPEDVNGDTVSVHSEEKLYGGTWQEWYSIFQGVCGDVDLPLIELAFVIRVDEAASA